MSHILSTSLSFLVCKTGMVLRKGLMMFGSSWGGGHEGFRPPGDYLQPWENPGGIGKAIF